MTNKERAEVEAAKVGLTGGSRIYGWLVHVDGRQQRQHEFYAQSKAQWREEWLVNLDVKCPRCFGTGWVPERISSTGKRLVDWVKGPCPVCKAQYAEKEIKPWEQSRPKP